MSLKITIPRPIEYRRPEEFSGHLEVPHKDTIVFGHQEPIYLELEGVPPAQAAIGACQVNIRDSA